MFTTSENIAKSFFAEGLLFDLNIDCDLLTRTHLSRGYFDSTYYVISTDLYIYIFYARCRTSYSR